MHGQGILRKPNGYKYQGSWVNGVPQGRGRDMTEDQTKYTGDFVNGVK